MESSCESLECLFGANCAINELTQQPYCQCEQRCGSRLKDTVCGTDGKTYSNECQLNLTACTIQTYIGVLHKGECGIVNNDCSSEKCEFGAVCTKMHRSSETICRCPENCLDSPRVKKYLHERHRGVLKESLALISDPICGDDGKDYNNFCELMRSSCAEGRQINIKYSGKCDPCFNFPCSEKQVCKLDENRNAICDCNKHECSLDQQNVTLCASNGKTYLNDCFLKQDSCRTNTNIAIVAFGNCDKVTQLCQRINCTFPMECNVSRQETVSCVCPQPCPKVFKPVCGSDGETYDSMCELQRKSCLTQLNISKVYDGFCSKHSFASKNERKHSCSPEDCPFGGQCLIEFKQEPIIRCHCPQCSDEYSPVCGSDNISYNNECSLRKASCEHKKTIHVLRQGLCRGCEELKCKHYAVCELSYDSNAECVCPQVCLRVDAPVCGSDGNTYENECELRVRSCKLQTPISIASVGQCDRCRGMSCKNGARCENGHCNCPTECSEKILEPICANDGTTYRNECELRKVACQKDLDLRALFYGHCDDTEDETNGYKLLQEIGSGDADMDTDVAL